MKKPSGAWRIGLSDVLIAAGVLVLWTGALFWTRTALAAGQVSAYRYLPAASRLALPLPELVSAGGPLRLGFSPAPETSSDLSPAAGVPPVAGIADPGSAAQPLPTAATEPPVAGNTAVAGIANPGSPDAPPSPLAATELAVSGVADPGSPDAPPSPLAATELAVSGVADPGSLTATERPRLVEPTPLEALALPSPTPTPAPTAEPTLPPYSPIIRIVIPSLDIDRAVTPVGLRPDAGGALGWDTDSLFSTRNRPDLVGQLVGSSSPGQGGNILLIGHNYNQVDYGWTGVFVNIKNLKAGDLIGVFTEDGRQVNYQVQLVKQVPWRSQSAEELEKHQKFMGPSAGEQLTLVTCGGANIWPFPARVYVVAAPVP